MIIIWILNKFSNHIPCRPTVKSKRKYRSKCCVLAREIANNIFQVFLKREIILVVALYKTINKFVGLVDKVLSL